MLKPVLKIFVPLFAAKYWNNLKAVFISNLNQKSKRLASTMDKLVFAHI